MKRCISVRSMSERSRSLVGYQPGPPSRRSRIEKARLRSTWTIPDPASGSIEKIERIDGMPIEAMKSPYEICSIETIVASTRVRR